MQCLYKSWREVNFSYKSRRVVIPSSLGVSKSLQQRVGLHDLIFKRHLGVLLLALPRTHHGEVGDDFLGVLSLSSARFSAKILN